MYECYGDDHENLDRQVAAARGQKPVDVDVVRMGSLNGGKHWKVAVTCSKGHINVFEGSDEGPTATIPD